MTAVTFRKMRFDLDSSVPFQWNQANPASGVLSNAISFIAVGFERYIVLAVKDALTLMTDSQLREEAEIFIAQEAQHSAAHRKHVNALIAQYPGLADTLRQVIKAYEDLYAAKPLEFHLAYVASLEATFPPLFTFMIEHREQLFNGDSRVASLFLWHYVEEIEHRSSAAIVYDGVVDNRWYRVRTLPTSMSHIVAVTGLIVDGFRSAVPAQDIGVDPGAATVGMARGELMSRLPFIGRRHGSAQSPVFQGIPTSALLKLVAGLVRSQLPFHHPGSVRAPAWYQTWMTSYTAGEDMAHYFGIPPRTENATTSALERSS